jgi:hypothetical protein
VSSIEAEISADDGLLLLANDAMRARRRPGAIALVWLWETLVAALIFWPASALVRAAYADHPRGDAVLWDPGGYSLMDFLVNARYGMQTLSALAFVALALASVAGLLPMSGLLASIAYATRERRAPALRHAATRALHAFKAMIVLLIVAAIAEGALAIVGLVFGAVTQSGVDASAGEARAQQIGWLVTALFLSSSRCGSRCARRGSRRPCARWITRIAWCARSARAARRARGLWAGARAARRARGRWALGFGLWRDGATLARRARRRGPSRGIGW